MQYSNTINNINENTLIEQWAYSGFGSDRFGVNQGIIPPFGHHFAISKIGSSYDCSGDNPEHNISSVETISFL